MKRFFSFNTIIAGRVFNETIINKNKQILINNPGGGVLYAAAGFCIWEKGAGLIANISENNSIEWTQEFEDYNLDTSGIKRIPCDFEQRRFYSITDSNKVFTDNPQKHFFKIKHRLILINFKFHYSLIYLFKIRGRKIKIHGKSNQAITYIFGYR